MFRPRSYNGLLVSLLVLIVVSPLVQYLGSGRWLLELTLAGVLVFAIYAVIGDRRRVKVTLSLGVAAVVSRLVVAAWSEPPVIVAALGFLLTLCFLVAVIAALMLHILSIDRVSGDTLRGATCVYLLLAIAWAMAYGFVDLLEPNAFTRADHFVGQGESLELHIYFSFVTLTTLGYGDISPISPAARTLAWLEACIGQLFVAITIARLVSLYIAGNHSYAEVDESGTPQ